MNKDKGLFTVLTVAWMAFVLSFSIAVPVLCRPFYYAHIKAYDLVEYSGHSYEECRQAYDEMMDFCLFGGEFSAGVMKFSEEGKAHFEDVAVLFKIDFAVLAVSSAVMIISLIKKKSGYRPYGYGYRYWGSWLLMIVFSFLAIVASIDFSRFFILFHLVFFPGKTNWTFNPYRDEIINILPEEFFRNCAIAIVLIMVVMCVGAIWQEKRSLKEMKA